MKIITVPMKCGLVILPNITCSCIRKMGMRVVAYPLDLVVSIYPYSGTMFGLRTWDKDNAGFKTLFQEIKLGEGFSMNIQEVEFISPTQIKVSFDQKIRDVVKRNMITVQGHNVSAAQLLQTRIVVSKL